MLRNYCKRVLCSYTAGNNVIPSCHIGNHQQADGDHMTALEAIALVSNTTWACSFEFPGQGQRETPVTGCTGMLRIIQLLKEEQAAQYRQNMASLLEKYLDADMGLADDITDRAL